LLIALRRFGEATAVIDAGLALKADDTELLDQKAFCLWNGRDDPATIERTLAAAPASTLATGNLALQALYQRRYAQAAELFRRAIASSGKARSESSFNEYLPAAIDYRLHWALSEDRLGSSASAADLYRQVQTQARAELAAKPANVNVAAALHMVAGLAAAGLGQRDEAVVEGRRAVALMPEATDAADGPRWQAYLARIYAANGDADHALQIIGHLLDTTYPEPLTAAMLRLDPIWDPIRHDPRFQALLKQYGTHAVVEAPAAGDAPPASTASGQP
jgi:serine/threonine-protein kinase